MVTVIFSANMIRTRTTSFFIVVFGIWIRLRKWFNFAQIPPEIRRRIEGHPLIESNSASEAL